MQHNESKETELSFSNDRIELIDSLRGYALIGLFLVHMVEYYEIYWFQPVDSFYKDFTFAIFGAKSYAMFALLFGVSFFIILNSRKKQGINFLSQITRRFGFLFILGLLHGLLYGGDILQILAIAGFIMISLHLLPLSVLWTLSTILLLQIPFVFYYIFIVSAGHTAYDQPLHWNMYGEVYKVYATGNFKELISINFPLGNFAKWTFMLESGRLFTILGMTVLGYCLGQKGFFNPTKKDFKKYGSLLIISLVLAGLFYFAKPLLNTIIQRNPSWMKEALLDSYRDLLYTFVSIFAFAFVYQLGFLKKVLNTLAPCGRMTLTLYVFQSIVFVPFFYGFGIGAYRFLGQANSFFLGLVFWIIQIIFASYWIRKYYYGPIEWVWRSFTLFKKDIRLRRL